MLQSECGCGVINKAFDHLTFILFFFWVQQQQQNPNIKRTLIHSTYISMRNKKKKNHHEHKLPEEKNQGLTEMHEQLNREKNK